MRTKEWLKNKRIEYSITQRQLANAIGVSTFAIEQIEQGKRMGSADTWKKIENYFNNNDDSLIKLSYDCEDLIEEIKQDIEEFGEDKECILVYKVVDDYIFFTNYDFITEKMPFSKNELRQSEKYIETTLKYALEVFESQNKIA